HPRQDRDRYRTRRRRRPDQGPSVGHRLRPAGSGGLRPPAAGTRPLPGRSARLRRTRPDRQDHPVRPPRRPVDRLRPTAKPPRSPRPVGPLTGFDRATIAAAVSPQASDRKTAHVYDAEGRERFVLQTDTIPFWSVSENRYDALGKIIESRGYDRQVTDAWIGSVDT